MGRRISTNVQVFDQTEGYVRYKPGTREEEIPEEHLAQITNPKCWAEPDAFSGEVPTGNNGRPVYEEMTNRQLVELCRQRELTPETLRKADLVACLEAADAAE